MITLFCALVGQKGSPFPIDIDAVKTVGHLKVLVKKENKRRIRCDAAELDLYLAKKDDGTWLTENDLTKGVTDMVNFKSLHVAAAPLYRVGLSEQDVRFNVTDADIEANEVPVHVLVVVKEGVGSMAVPALSYLPATYKMLSWDDIDPRTTSPYRVDSNEFTLSDYNLHSLMTTTKLNQFFHNYGSFPARYFVREEENKLWDIMLDRLDDSETGQTRRASHSTCIKKRKIKSTVIVGSPGVGKSVFLMMLAFYIALVRNRPVLILRKLKEDKGVTYIFMKASGFSRGLIELSNFFNVRRFFADTMVFLDGFTDIEVNDANSIAYLRPFRVLATSCQYDAQSDDPASLVVLPAWRMNDLQAYATKTEWVKDVELRQRQHIKKIPDLVKLQYFYSGGSMREFCRNHNECVERCVKAVRVVSQNQKYLLISNFGQERQKQGDRIRRHYIEDTSNSDHYQSSLYWQKSVDSGWAIRWLQCKREVGDVYDFYKYAKSIGGGFYGTAFEVLFHHTVQQYHLTHKILLRTSDTCEYTRVEIEIDHVRSLGNDLKGCHSILKLLDDGTYWYPEYGYFPFIDSVCPCRLVERSGRVVEKLAFIQVTVAKAKVFRPHRMAELLDLQRSNPHLSGYEPIYLVVTPSRNSCDAFELFRQVDSNAIDAADNDPSDHESECSEKPDAIAMDEEKHSVQRHGASPDASAMEVAPPERQSPVVTTSVLKIVTYVDPESIFYYKTGAHLVEKDTEDSSQKKRKHIW